MCSADKAPKERGCQSQVRALNSDQAVVMSDSTLRLCKQSPSQMVGLAGSWQELSQDFLDVFRLQST